MREQNRQLQGRTHELEQARASPSISPDLATSRPGVPPLCMPSTRVLRACLRVLATPAPATRLPRCALALQAVGSDGLAISPEELEKLQRENLELRLKACRSPAISRGLRRRARLATHPPTSASSPLLALPVLPSTSPRPLPPHIRPARRSPRTTTRCSSRSTSAGSRSFWTCASEARPCPRYHRDLA